MRFRYEELDITSVIQALIKDIYILTEKFPKDERFGLTSQIRRAATSILLNLAEGSARKSTGDYSRFIKISIGSFVEMDAGMKIAVNLGYLQTEAWQIHDDKVKRVYFSLIALRNSIEAQRATSR